MIGLFLPPRIGFILALLVSLCERVSSFAEDLGASGARADCGMGGLFMQACVFSLLVHKYPSVKRRQTIAGLRTSSLARRPRPISLVHPRHGGPVVRLSRSRRVDHPAVRIPGVILEAVTTSVFPTCGTPYPPNPRPSSSLAPRSDMLSLFKSRIDPYTHVSQNCPGRPSFLLCFFFLIGIYCIVLAITSINAYTNRVSCPSNASCSYYYPPQTQRTPYPPPHETQPCVVPQ